jgi:hypothetical protein
MLHPLQVGQSPVDNWIASSAEPVIGLAEGETWWPPRNDESMILQVGIIPLSA